MASAAEPTRVQQPPTNLPTEDGVPLESDWHRLAMNLLIELVSLRLLGRQDFFVGGNMFIYFDAAQFRDRHFRGPDFFFVWDVPLNPPRPSWMVWQEGGKYPDVIIELSSPSTASEDHGPKKRTYERVFHTSEYFIYDPDDQQLVGWRLDAKQRYRAIRANEHGWLWCEQLELWLGTAKCSYLSKEAIYLRFFDKEGNIVPSGQERLDAEKRRADALEAELARLRARRKRES